MTKFGKYFKYDGKTTEDFGLIIGSFENKTETEIGLERSVDRGESNTYRTRANHFGTYYDDVLTFEITLIKDPCKFSGEDLYFTRSETRKINRWLTSSHYPILFHMTDYDNHIIADEQVDYFGIFNSVEAHKAVNIAGLTFTFTCDSPFAYSSVKEEVITSETSVNSIIYNDSDEAHDYVYPLLKITPNIDGIITIKNETDSNGTMDINCLIGNVVYIDAQKLKVTDLAGGLISFEKLGINDVDNIYWMRFCSGENKIKIIGNATVRFTWREARKVGAY